MSQAQQTPGGRKERKHKGEELVRVQLQVPAKEVFAIRDYAALLRMQTETTQALRTSVRAHVPRFHSRSAFDIFGSDLPDSYFDGVFNETRTHDLPRGVEF